jgi:RHH-type proline utilization regulon transcriptional repressor/proline dehydrogenase/delta 1-pyrroline-5-carboxylate dehydrogenase
MTTAHDRSLRLAIRKARRANETACLGERLQRARLEPGREQQIQKRARCLAERARNHALHQMGLDAFLQEYDLSSREGVLLMCIAEALLRIPDTETADRLISDRLSRGHWDDHLGASSSVLVNASSWGLLLTGRLFSMPDTAQASPEQLLKRLVARAGEPFVRRALQTSVQLLARQFVMGRTIQEAVQRTGKRAPALRYSYDCLGEAAHTAADATRYFETYREALHYIGKTNRSGSVLIERPGISVKLSALHSRYEYSQRQRVLRELVPQIQLLIDEAMTAGINLTLDAEEADNLELSLDLIECLLTDLRDCSWQGLGLAVQAYQKSALPVLQWLHHLALTYNRRIQVRLVKGAYWDTEIKRAQERGLDSYPVFTRKAATDVSYLACARFLMRNTDLFFPQMASHNALTLAWVNEIGQGHDYELQRLHGMGDSLFKVLPEFFNDMPPVRIYAPVGSHEELLPYLVRRLLENGANSSFVNQLTDERTALDELVENPCDHINDVECKPHPDIPLPAALYGEERRNARGWDLSDPDVVSRFDKQISQVCSETWHAAACVGGEELRGEGRPLMNPADYGQTVGDVVEADTETVDRALALAAEAAPGWDNAGGSQRAQYLYKTADLFEARVAELVARIVCEGGRTLQDAVSEVREAVDFCRYYAFRAEQEFSSVMALPGPTGERNELQLHGRGVFACISPWNFPLAIFVGQIAAALAAGNTVLAKPARQTPLTGYQAVCLMHEAGVPADVLHFLPGSGVAIGSQLCADQRLGGVAFTGSTESAWSIQRALADRRGPIVPLIAETGGQNVMIADSSALPEQLVSDVLQSAFNSAGQRCSALRVLFVQHEIADAVISQLTGAMEEVTIGNPVHLATDVGPLIDQQAIQDLQPHIDRMRRKARLLKCIEPGPELEAGCFFPLYAFELESLNLLQKEEFGPVLHVIRYQGGRLDRVIEAVNATGYGLTLGVHSRVEKTWQQVQANARVGNLYINRNMIGAVVGAQPFGGEGLSGTGPKAGGPYYLHRFATERTLSVNTAAVGGNPGLLSMRGD